jgi:hypothetical protein
MTKNPTDLIHLVNDVALKETLRLRKDRESRELKVEEDAAKALLIQYMEKEGITDYTTPDGIQARVAVIDKPYISAWDELEKYIRENDAVDLLERRLSKKAVVLRWDDGVPVPGVGLARESKVTVK